MNPVRRFVVATCVMVIASSAFAQERASKEEAKVLCEAAAAHLKKVGFAQAKKDFAADKAKWMPKDLYPFVVDNSGVMQFHISEKFIGMSTLGIVDASGKYFGKEMFQVYKSPKGIGWVDYEWVHPVTKKVEDKTSYVQRVDGTDYFVGVGVYR